MPWRRRGRGGRAVRWLRCCRQTIWTASATTATNSIPIFVSSIHSSILFIIMIFYSCFFFFFLRKGFFSSCFYRYFFVLVS
ncbi:unnamed protein product, partial [Brassica oleracea var. botrytis]